VRCLLADVLRSLVASPSPVGHGLCSFVLEYLVHGDQAPALNDVGAALSALAAFDRDLASCWRALIDQPSRSDGAEMVLGDFDDSCADEPVTPANIERAVLSGCAQRLLGSRRAAFDALRSGFVRCEDLSIQLATFGTADELALVLQGKQTLSAQELLDCFELPHSSVDEEYDAGFAAAGSRADEYFEQVLRDEEQFGDTCRLAMLRWCTALSALPVGGLQDNKVKLRLYGVEVDDNTLPETHTCTREVGKHGSNV
jgi:hypothetical protein